MLPRKDVGQGNWSAPRAADVDGAAAKSAKKTRKETNQEASDVEGAVLESQAGKKKRRRRPMLLRLKMLPKVETGQAIPGP